MDDARRAEDEVMSGHWRGPLHGIPVAVKDVYATAGAATEAGSRVLKGFTPLHDAHVVRKLREGGAILVGKTITPEFAYGQHQTPTMNPWRPGYSPGGSSTGSAVAVAVGSAIVAMGTDTGGSIRTPASLNGVVGFKPSRGWVSNSGVVPLSETLDHCGPLARTVEDAAIVLSVVGESTGRRMVSIAGLNDSLHHPRVGVDLDYWFDSGLQPDVRAAVEHALGVLKDCGVRVVPIRIPLLEQAGPAGLTIMLAEASSYHQAPLRQRPADYYPGTRLMLELGELVPATDYLRALRLRNRLTESMRSVFRSQRLQAIVAPTLPSSARPIASLPAPPRFAGRYTIPFNLTGQPAVSIPCGFSADGMPIGLQIAGRRNDDEGVLRLAHAFQRATNWHLMAPPMPAGEESPPRLVEGSE
jgi:aspartyl-tRNA(Asn)/glutamyl-tRNA(Gln) amidotransferase subunit A